MTNKEKALALINTFATGDTEKAKELLIQGKPCKEVCSFLSFSSQSHFITSFKKYYHMTPTEYLKMIR